MTEVLLVATDNLLSPLVLFFVLGTAAGRLRSDLAVPEPISRALSLYLMLAIGFKGGAALAANGVSATVAASLLVALLLSFGLPVLAYALLRLVTPLGTANAAAVAAHYGSVSVVTFTAATSFLGHQGMPWEGHLVAMLALMETPAIITGLLLARRRGGPGAPVRGPLVPRAAVRDALLSGSVVLLVGSFAIGWITGSRGMAMMAPAIVEPFAAVLAVFLLDVGLLVGRRLRDRPVITRSVAAFGLYMPLIGAAIGLLAGHILALSAGGMTLVAVLGASASYIAAPAAIRASLPEADPAIYVTLSLAVTFPFNLIVGIPLYHAVATAMAGM